MQAIYAGVGGGVQDVGVAGVEAERGDFVDEPGIGPFQHLRLAVGSTSPFIHLLSHAVNLPFSVFRLSAT